MHRFRVFSYFTQMHIYCSHLIDRDIIVVQKVSSFERITVELNATTYAISFLRV